MTTIIIQGDKLEANKTIDVLRKTFPVINKKASFINEDVYLKSVFSFSKSLTASSFKKKLFNFLSSFPIRYVFIILPP